MEVECYILVGIIFVLATVHVPFVCKDSNKRWQERKLSLFTICWSAKNVPFKTFEEKKDLACLKERVIHFDLMLHIHTYFWSKFRRLHTILWWFVALLFKWTFYFCMDQGDPNAVDFVLISRLLTSGDSETPHLFSHHACHCRQVPYQNLGF